MAIEEFKFPENEHGDCRALTQITIESLSPGAALGVARKYSRNAEIWQPDDRSDRLYFLERGEVGIVAADREGREVLLATITAGEPFGELCFCNGPTAHRRTTARATTNSAAVEIKVEDFIYYTQQNSEVLQRCLFTFCVRLGRAERRIEILALRGAEERLCNILLHLAETRGVAAGTEHPQTFKLNITHDELANLAALSRQRVTITMNRLRSLGLVRYERNQPLRVDTIALTAHLNSGVG
jgi:CRP/FNR family cyclic AMP-dependent transcriptional regulator